jgi:nucleoside-diphosphate-sugar epimerase
MKVVVTGATGFLGTRLVEVLLESGYEVIATGRNPKSGAYLSQIGARFLAGDLSDAKFVDSLIPEQAAVVHCAALSSPWGTRHQFYEANVVATQNVAQAALRRHCPRFVHISTPSIYIEKRSKLDIREDSAIPHPSINLYAETKLEAESIIDRLTEQGLPAISIRPQGLFGPRDQTILPRLIRLAERGVLPVIGTEETQIDLTYVDNVVDAIVLALRAPTDLIGKKYNITNGEPQSQTQLFQRILEGLGYSIRLKHVKLGVAWAIATTLEWVYRVFELKGEPVLTRYSVSVLAFSRTLNIEAAHRELGYQPRVSIKEGIERTLQWYKTSRS